MLQSYLLPPQISRPNYNNNEKGNAITKQQKFPQLSKYIENEFMKRSLQKEQEKRRSLLLESYNIEEEYNKIQKKKKGNKLDQEQFLLHQKLEQAQFNIQNQFKIFDKNQFETKQLLIKQMQNSYQVTEQQEVNFRKRSSTVSARDKALNLSFIHQNDQPLEQKHKQQQFYCNEILDFKITPDIKSSVQSPKINTVLKSIPNYFNFIQDNFTQGYQSVQSQYSKLQKQIKFFKLWGLNFVFILRIRRILQKKDNIYKQKLSSFKKMVEQQEQIRIKQIERMWCEKLTSNVFHYLQQHKFVIYFKFNKNPNEKDIVSLRKKWLLEMTKGFFRNISEMTQNQNLIKEIIQQAQYQITLQNNQYSNFVQKRVNKKMSQNEQLIIVSEYIYFSLIINHILEFSNKQTYINEQHVAECKFQLVSLCSFLQIMFQNFFQKYPIYYKNKEASLIKKLNIIIEKAQYLELIDEKQSNPLDQVILGFYSETFYSKLIKENQQWYKDIQLLFNDSQNNLTFVNKF